MTVGRHPARRRYLHKYPIRGAKAGGNMSQRINISLDIAAGICMHVCYFSGHAAGRFRYGHRNVLPINDMNHNEFHSTISILFFYGELHYTVYTDKDTIFV
jgi:hypothetical protein